VPFAYSSEVFPLLNREAGMSFAVFCNLFGAGNGPPFVKIVKSKTAMLILSCRHLNTLRPFINERAWTPACSQSYRSKQDTSSFCRSAADLNLSSDSSTNSSN
jgi:hypothetical protein